MFPHTRMRRLRKSNSLRRLNSDTHLHPNDFIYPIFLDENLPTQGNHSREVPSMPGVSVHNLDSGKRQIELALQKGIPGIILFGVPEHKDERGSGGDKPAAIVPRFASEIKKSYHSEITLIADLCLCEYTSHGHCGILTPEGKIDNDTTLARLADYTRKYAGAGVDVIAPSGMMDGMVQAIRRALDEKGYNNTAILSYAVKYASAYYGPFRDAAQSSPSFGDRKSYQMPYDRSWEPFREVELDVQEGADMVMVKPALPYLDTLQRLKGRFSLPIFAYQVSGEYAMIQLGGQQGLFDSQEVMLESLTAIKRAGATGIISYAALDFPFEQL